MHETERYFDENGDEHFEFTENFTEKLIEKVVHIVKIVVVVVHSIASLFLYLSLHNFLFSKISDKKFFPYLL